MNTHMCYMFLNIQSLLNFIRPLTLDKKTLIIIIGKPTVELLYSEHSYIRQKIGWSQNRTLNKTGRNTDMRKQKKKKRPRKTIDEKLHFFRLQKAGFDS